MTTTPLQWGGNSQDEELVIWKKVSKKNEERKESVRGATFLRRKMAKLRGNPLGRK